jgi:hypothetical protein
MSARGQDDEQRPREATTIRRGIVHEPEPAEVDLGQFAWRDVGHADGDAGARPEAAVLHGEAMEGAVRHGDARPRQQLVHLRQAEAAFLGRRWREPRANLLDVALELRFDLAGVAIARGMQSTSELGRERFRGRLALRGPPEIAGDPLVPPYGAAAVARRPGDRRFALAAGEPLED